MANDWTPARLASEAYGYIVRDWETPADDTVCNGCGCDDQPFGKLLPIGECSLTVGDPSPAGRCPDCEGLCYVIEPATPTPEQWAAALAHIRTLSELIDQALTTHIYDESNGDEPDEDCAYTAATEAADAFLAEVSQ